MTEQEEIDEIVMAVKKAYGVEARFMCFVRPPKRSASKITLAQLE